MTSEALELLFTVTTSIHTASGKIAAPDTISERRFLLGCFLLLCQSSLQGCSLLLGCSLLSLLSPIIHFGGDTGLQTFVCGCVQCNTGVAQSWLIALGNKNFHKNLVWPHKTGQLIAVQLQFGITVSWKNIPLVKEHPPPHEFWLSFLQGSKFTQLITHQFCEMALHTWEWMLVQVHTLVVSPYDWPNCECKGSRNQPFHLCQEWHTKGSTDYLVKPKSGGVKLQYFRDYSGIFQPM